MSYAAAMRALRAYCRGRNVRPETIYRAITAVIAQYDREQRCRAATE